MQQTERKKGRKKEKKRKERKKKSVVQSNCPICRTDGGEISDIGQSFPVYLSIACFIRTSTSFVQFLVSYVYSARVYDDVHGYSGNERKKIGQDNSRPRLILDSLSGYLKTSI